MKILFLRCFVIAATLLAVIAYGENKQTNYKVANLDSLGGTTSGGIGINNRGWITGSSNLDGDQIVHAALWKSESPIDLGTLGGPNTSSSILWPIKNKRGVISGISQTDELDPLGEAWSCSAFIPNIGHTCVGFVWKDGEMNPLPTLGGSNGFAAGINKFGQIVGWAENTVHDPTCNPLSTQKLQFLAVVWDSDQNLIQTLPPLQGDSVSSATEINDKGQIVGISGACDRAVGRLSAAHAVIWEDGSPTDLGNIGGNAWNTPMAINESGEVVGFANVAQGTPFNAHAFRWTKNDGIEDIGTLPISEHRISQALGINKKGQIVGISCAPGFVDCRAFLYENGEMTDLNTMVPGYTGFLVFANDINDSGEITGGAIDADTGEAVTFLATPIHGHHEDDVAESFKTTRADRHLKKDLALSERARQMILQRMGLAGVPWME